MEDKLEVWEGEENFGEELFQFSFFFLFLVGFGVLGDVGSSVEVSMLVFVVSSSV